MVYRRTPESGQFVPNQEAQPLPEENIELIDDVPTLPDANVEILEDEPDFDAIAERFLNMDLSVMEQQRIMKRMQKEGFDFKNWEAEIDRYAEDERKKRIEGLKNLAEMKGGGAPFVDHEHRPMPPKPPEAIGNFSDAAKYGGGAKEIIPDRLKKSEPKVEQVAKDVVEEPRMDKAA